MGKILTVAIPCYNSAAYMEKCIRSLLPEVYPIASAGQG